MKRQSFQTVVLGGGQAGLAAAYYLSKGNSDYGSSTPEAGWATRVWRRQLGA